LLSLSLPPAPPPFIFVSAHTTTQSPQIPNLETFTFAGVVKINVDVSVATTTVQLHSKELFVRTREWGREKGEKGEKGRSGKKKKTKREGRKRE